MMAKRWLMGLLALAMVAWLGSSVLAQGPAPKGPRKGGPGAVRPEPGKIFAQFDKDQSGTITKEELPERAAEHFSKMDTNGDGAISKEEFLEAVKKMRPERPGGPGRQGPDPEQIFKRLDKNTDGKLDKEDKVPEQVWQRISKADANNDGAVTKEELVAMIKKHMEARKGQGGPGPGRGPRDPGQMFQRADKNSDGKITKEEVPAQLWERIGKADADGDGAVSKEEFKKALQERTENRKPERKKKAAKD